MSGAHEKKSRGSRSRLAVEHATHEVDTRLATDRDGALLNTATLQGVQGQQGIQDVHSLHDLQAILEIIPDAVVVTDGAGRITHLNRQSETLFGYSSAEVLDQPIEILLPERFTTVHQEHRAQYQAAPHLRPMGVGLSLCARHRDGREIPVEVSLSPVRLPVTADASSDEAGESGESGAQAKMRRETQQSGSGFGVFGVLATVRDISARQRLEMARVEAEVATEELRRLQAIMDVALAHRSVDTLLPALLERVCTSLRVDNASILLLDAEGRTVRVRATWGLEGVPNLQQPVPLGVGLAGRVAAERAPVVVEDLAAFPVANPSTRERMRSAVGAPLFATGQLTGQLIGVLQIGSTAQRTFTERDVRLLQLVAERIALAIEQARLHDAEQEALAQARLSEARFQRLMASNTVGLLVVNETTAVEANDAVLRMLGYTRADLVAGRIRQDVINPPEYQSVTTRAFYETLTTGASRTMEKELVRQDGSHVPVLVGSVPLQQDPPRALIVVLDLTDVRRLEHEQRWLSTLLDQTHDAMFIWEWGGPITYWNRGAELLYGYSHEEAVGQVSHALLRTLHPGPLKDIEERLVQAGEWTGELVHTTKTSKQITVLSRHQLLRAPDGRQVVLESSYDITDRKRLEREREEARARELTLTEVNEQLDRFFAMAAHDIRNPVTVVRTSVQLTLRTFDQLVMAAAAVCATAERAAELASEPMSEPVPEPESAPVREGVRQATEEGVRETIRAQVKLQVKALEAQLALTRSILTTANEGGDTLSRLVARLFDVAKARAGMLDVELALCDLTQLVREQVDIQRRAAPHRVITLETPAETATYPPLEASAETAATTPTDRERPHALVVLGDADRLAQVVTNFVTNALKYSSDEAPVSVRIERVNGHALVAVRDAGAGLPAEELDHVWELYHRGARGSAGSETRDRPEGANGRGGLGLGLYICRSIIEAHHGQVGVESELGHGSTFWFTLPLATAEERQASARRHSSRLRPQ